MYRVIDFCSKKLIFLHLFNAFTIFIRNYLESKTTITTNKMSAVKTLVDNERKTLVDNEELYKELYEELYEELYPYADLGVDEESIIVEVNDSLELGKKKLIIVNDNDSCDDIMEKIGSISGNDSIIQETESTIRLLEIAMCNINTYIDKNQDVADEKEAIEKAKEWINRFQTKLEEVNDLLSQQKKQSDYLWREFTKRAKLLDDVSNE